MLGCGRIVSKPIDLFPKVLNSVLSVRHCKGVSQSEESVLIPARIERGPTDILKALASTVEVDTTAFHYKYPDDPYFYPYSLFSKKVYALSLESGRQSAKWIFENNPGFFKNQLSDPPIKAFIPKSPQNSPQAEVTEETLIDTIVQRDVKEAIRIYKILENQKSDVSKSTKQCLLELVCFYNCEQRSIQNLEEKYFIKEFINSGNRNTWKDGNFAQELFESMDQSCPLANSAIIQGMLKYDNVESALKIFEEAKVKKIKLSVGVYNGLLSQTFRIIQSGNEVLQYVKTMLKEMSQLGIKPNIGTLNAALQSLIRERVFDNKIVLAQDLITEFKNLGISPSLGSYAYLFRIMSTSRTERFLPLVREILKDIEDKEHEILDPTDLTFFTTTMKFLSIGSYDTELALQLNRILWRNNNIKFITNVLDQQTYFKYFFNILFYTTPIDFAMDFYKRYVFTMFSLELEMLRVILSAIHANLSCEYLVQIWNDVKSAALSRNRVALREFLFLAKDFTDEAALDIFYAAANDFMEKMDFDEIGAENPEIISNILITYVRIKEEKRIFQIMEIIKKYSEVIHLDEGAIKTIYEYAVSKKNDSLIVDCLKLASAAGNPSVSEMAENALPLLNYTDKAWASELIKQEKNEGK